MSRQPEDYTDPAVSLRAVCVAAVLLLWVTAMVLLVVEP